MHLLKITSERKLRILVSNTRNYKKAFPLGIDVVSATDTLHCSTKIKSSDISLRAEKQREESVQSFDAREARGEFFYRDGHLN